MTNDKQESADKIVGSSDGLGALPCPFCGESDLKIGQSPGGFFWVYCLPCHIRRHTFTSKEAVLEWNRRASNAELRREP